MAEDPVIPCIEELRRQRYEIEKLITKLEAHSRPSAMPMTAEHPPDPIANEQSTIPDDPVQTRTGSWSKFIGDLDELEAACVSSPPDSAKYLEKRSAVLVYVRDLDERLGKLSAAKVFLRRSDLWCQLRRLWEALP